MVGVSMLPTNDNGENFYRYSKAPIIERNKNDLE
jgi:hypothetical protein